MRGPFALVLAFWKAAKKWGRDSKSAWPAKAICWLPVRHPAYAGNPRQADGAQTWELQAMQVLCLHAGWMSQRQRVSFLPCLRPEASQERVETQWQEGQEDGAPSTRPFEALGRKGKKAHSEGSGSPVSGLWCMPLLASALASAPTFSSGFELAMPTSQFL